MKNSQQYSEKILSSSSPYIHHIQVSN